MEEQVSTKARNRFVKDHSSEVRKPIESIELLLPITHHHDSYFDVSM